MKITALLKRVDFFYKLAQDPPSLTIEEMKLQLGSILSERLRTWNSNPIKPLLVELIGKANSVINPQVSLEDEIVELKVKTNLTMSIPPKDFNNPIFVVNIIPGDSVILKNRKGVVYSFGSLDAEIARILENSLRQSIQEIAQSERAKFYINTKNVILNSDIWKSKTWKEFLSKLQSPVKIQSSIVVLESRI